MRLQENGGFRRWLQASGMQIEGKVVLITGASEGIGAACVAAFRARGAKLVLTARSADKLRAIADSDELCIPADLLHPDTPATLISRTVQRFGRIDIVVNNAGAGIYLPAHDTPPDDAKRLFDLNFFAPLEVVRHCAPHMKTQRSGTIVNVSSIAGPVTLPWMTVYSASKAALLSLTDGLRTELRRFGIHCMAVCPGYVNTGFQRNILAGRVPPALGSMRSMWAITAAKCAEAIVRGVERNARTVVTPAKGRLLIGFSRAFPSVLDRRLESAMLSQEADS